VVLKAVTGGYDGRGVWIVDDLEQATVVLEDAHGRGVDLIAEQHLQLTGEIAVLVARTADGDCRVFPATETVQRGGICHLLRVPAGFGVAIAARAEELALRIADIVESVGILAVEFFVIGADVLVNELAPRPHNSGHWTIEGTVVSQFEQHLRAVLGWPLGSTAMTAKAVVTRNLLGPDDGSDPFTVLPDALATGRASIHWYGKSSRPGRKLGHVTAAADSVPEAEAIASNAWSILSRAPRVGT
jgi:5-(carboxyamino)imidazole ribonucleotide synthase